VTVDGPVTVMCRVCMREAKARVIQVGGQVFRALPAGWMQAAGRGGEGRLVCSGRCALMHVHTPPAAGSQMSLCCPGLQMDTACPERVSAGIWPLGTFSSIGD